MTIAPIARGVATGDRGASRYYPYYTKPWISDADFDPDHDPQLTGCQCSSMWLRRMGVRDRAIRVHPASYAVRGDSQPSQSVS